MGKVNESRMLLQQRGFTIPRTSGSSMRPLIWGENHCVVVIPLEAEPRVGDIIMFIQRQGAKEISVVHRVVRIEGAAADRVYITRGDNCLQCETVRSDEVVGRVAEVHRLSGYRPWHAIPFRKFGVDDRCFILYTRLWSALWPVRRLYYIGRAYGRVLLSRVLKSNRKVK